MNDNTQNQGRVITGIFIGIIVAFFSCVIVIGGFLLALSEGGVKLSLQASTSLPTTTPLSSSTNVPTLTPHPTETSLPIETTAVSSPTTTLTSSPTTTLTSTTPPTLPPTSTQSAPPPPTLAPTNPPQPPPGCGPPASWVIYIVKAGDTLYSIGRTYGVNVDQLIFANCLMSTTIRVGQQLYVPNVPPQLPAPTNTIIPVTTNTPTIPTTALPTNTLPPPPVPTQPPPNSGCGPPASWVIYVVQAGDTVYSISSAFNITVDQLKYANCLTSNAISPGQSLWVPNFTPNFPNPTNAVEPVASATPLPTTEPPTNTPPSAPTITPTVPTATSPPPTNSGAPAATKRVEPTLIASVTVSPPTIQPPP